MSDDERATDRPEHGIRRRGASSAPVFGPWALLRGSAAAVTPTGWFVVAILIVALVAALVFHWIEGWFFAVICALLLLSAVPFLAGARAYETAISVRSGRVIAGGALRVGVKIRNGSRRSQLPAVSELPVGEALRELVIPALRAGAETELPVEVQADRRGVLRVGPLTLARQDPLALVRREVRGREWHLVHVHPRTVVLPAHSAGLVRDLEGRASRRLSDADLSFYAVREYVPGDAVRHVHWKATAKTGDLMVRQYEETQTARVAIVFDALGAEYADAEEFELAVSVAASLSLQAVREGRERFIAATGFGRGVEGLGELPSLTPDQLLDAWSELNGVDAGLPLEVLAHRLAQARRELSVVALVTGSRPELARIQRAAHAFPADVHVIAIRADHLAEPRAQRVGHMSLLTVGDLADVPGLMLRGVT